MCDDTEWKFCDSRKKVILDGVVIDVTTLAKEAGYQCPVAISSTLWAKCVQISNGLKHQDEQGRRWDLLLWEVLLTLDYQHFDMTPPGLLLLFYVGWRDEKGTLRPLWLLAYIGPDDDGQPWVLIKLFVEE